MAIRASERPSDDTRPLPTPRVKHIGNGREYWNAVGESRAGGQGELWRRCSDAIHHVWLETVAADLHGATVLKTDLFDEAFGDGLAEWFERRGNRMIGCDVAFSTARGAARRAMSGGSVVSSVLDLPFGGGKFDCVISDSTLDHFESEAEIRRSLEELSRVLCPNGILLLTMDNPRHPIVALRNIFPAMWQKLGAVPYSVGMTCSARRLRQLLEAAGFEVIGTGAIMHAPRVLVVAICTWIERYRGIREPGGWWLGWLKRFEKLGRLPSREWTGHFVTAVARRRP